MDSLISHARAEYKSGERFLEFRLDYLTHPEDGVKAIKRFLARYPDCYLLATCRRKQNQGRFVGSVDEQVQILEDAVEAGAHAVDLEIESAENCEDKLAKLRSSTYVLLSYHNFGGTPPRLDAVLKRMTRIPAHGYKVVTTARKPSDNSRVLNLARKNPKVPTVVLAMGETGFPTRVLSTAFGGMYSYAAPNMWQGTASGQVSAQKLRGLYRVGKFSKDAKIYGVIGDPVGHSISPVVHNRGFQAKRINATYLPFLVHPGQLKDFFTMAKDLPLAGFSVTIPHKQKILRYLDHIDPVAKRIGAVNTVWKAAGRWRGTNTDAPGVTVPLKKHLKLNKSRILVVGNGGAARSALFALADEGAELAVTGRNIDRVRALATACGAEPMSREQAAKETFDGLVHATPLGMNPGADQCFFKDRIPAELVLDMVYTPMETEMIRRAKAQKAEIIYGLEMFIEQAARQFEIWTEQRPPRAVMHKAALEALEERNGATPSSKKK